jgi:hypothetical protein
MVSATPQRDGVLLRIEGSGAAPIATVAPTDRIGPVIRRTGFERYPLLPKNK